MSGLSGSRGRQRGGENHCGGRDNFSLGASAQRHQENGREGEEECFVHRLRAKNHAAALSNL